jgi:hypothetical protein
MLDADGINLGPDPDGMLADVLDQDAELVMPLADERWAWIPALLGRTPTGHPRPSDRAPKEPAGQQQRAPHRKCQTLPRRYPPAPADPDSPPGFTAHAKPAKIGRPSRR